MMLPDVAPVSGAVVAASLAGPVASAAAPVSSVVSEQAAATTPSQEQPDTAVVVSEGVAQSEPPVAEVTVPDAGQTESGAAAAASKGVAPSVPPEAQTEVATTTTSLMGSDTEKSTPPAAQMVASEGVAQSTPLAA